jgi:hypothetical protein
MYIKNMCTTKTWCYVGTDLCIVTKQLKLYIDHYINILLKKVHCLKYISYLLGGGENLFYNGVSNKTTERRMVGY